jgi:hypothetical protein
MKMGTTPSPWHYDALANTIGKSSTAYDLALCLKGGSRPDFAI